MVEFLLLGEIDAEALDGIKDDHVRKSFNGLCRVDGLPDCLRIRAADGPRVEAERAELRFDVERLADVL